MSSEQFHSTGNEALKSPYDTPRGRGDLVRAFLGRRDEHDKRWLQTWFQSNIEKHFADARPTSEESLVFDHIPAQIEAGPLAQSIKLKSFQAHYFRGFRKGLDRVDMGGDLIVIEGRNSSGKTSLAEALEWLFSGALSRRESSNVGDTRELENCIANVFRPDDEKTWVSAEFISYSSENNADTFTLRRLLQEDYGAAANGNL